MAALSRRDELDKILNLGNSLGRQGFNLLQRSLSVRHDGFLGPHGSSPSKAISQATPHTDTQKHAIAAKFSATG
jgi:hypothetical protein